MLLDDQGNLREPGWSRRMVQQYDRRMIQAPAFRIKEWDYYLFNTEDFAIAFLNMVSSSLPYRPNQTRIRLRRARPATMVQ